MSAGEVAAAFVLAGAVGGIWLADCSAHAAEASAQAFATVVDPVEVKAFPDGGGESSAPGQVHEIEGVQHVE